MDTEEDEGSSVDVIMANVNRWAVSYGDLMSVMMILFLLLYSFTSMRGLEGAQHLSDLQQMFGGKADKMLTNTIHQISFIAGGDLSGYAVVKVDEFQIKIMMTQAILFDSGQVNISSEAAPVLDKLIEMLKRIDNRIEIEGHTDDTPGPNFQVSSERALSVLNYFVEHGIDPARISLAGYGSNHPLVKNDSEENRKRNRRVEINILRKHSDLLKK